MLHHTRPLAIATMLIALFAVHEPSSAQSPPGPTADDLSLSKRFVAAKFLAPPEAESRSAGLVVALNNGPIELNHHRDQKLRIVDREFSRGIACHADSRIVVRLPSPGKTFSGTIGLDRNEQTTSGAGSVVFSVEVAGRAVFRSGVFRVETPATAIEIDLHGALEFTLQVDDADDGIGWDQADWAEARVDLADGSTVWLGDLPMVAVEDGLFSSDLPFSFTFDQTSSRDFLATWPVERAVQKIDERHTKHIMTFADPAGRISVRCEAVSYHDFPTVEWTLFFKNIGSKKSPIIRDIKSLDTRWQRNRSEAFRLHHGVGSPADGSDYSPLVSTFNGASTQRFGGSGGRSTNAHLSYFNLEKGPDEGLIVVVGWPGQWSADFTTDCDLGIRITAGQELTHFSLQPNEEVRTPLTVLQFWKGGDRIRAQNVWRRWMIAHNLPRPGGKLPEPILAAYSGGAYEEMYRATEETQLTWFNRYLEEKIKLDYWWMDAGWYPCDPVGWPKVGTWEVDRRRFPRGLRAITDHVHAHDTKTLLWFEPERVAKGTWLTENKPEWILGGKDGGIFNLGDPEALKWLTDRVDSILTTEGIDLYRQDFNIDPLSYWRAADAPDRQGITEIRHVTNLLAYFDELRRRHPNLLIDECASGGRRNDLEMMRRAVPMWRSDRTMEPTGQQSMTYGLSLWIPFFGTGTVAWGDAAYFITGKSPVESYGFWSSACPSLNLLFDVRERDLDYAKIRELVDQWRQVMPCWYGDFYPLTKHGRDSGDWMAWQFHRPESDDGVVQVFRRSESIYVSAQLRLRGLVPASTYRITRFDPPQSFDMSGRELIEKGLPLSLDQVGSAAVFLYRRLP